MCGLVSLSFDISTASASASEKSSKAHFLRFVTPLPSLLFFFFWPSTGCLTQRSFATCQIDVGLFEHFAPNKPTAVLCYVSDRCWLVWGKMFQCWSTVAQTSFFPLTGCSVVSEAELRSSCRLVSAVLLRSRSEERRNGACKLRQDV